MELLSLAKEVARWVEVAAASYGTSAAVTVVDADGNRVLQLRMTGAPAGSITLSERKAYTAALEGRPTGELGPEFAAMAVGGGRYCVAGGGAPLKHRQGLVGGVGVSSGTEASDVAIVDAALSAVRAGRGAPNPLAAASLDSNESGHGG